MSMLRLLSVLLLSLLSGSVFAADPQNLSIASTAVSGHTDLSMTYLAMVFGQMGTVLHGTSGQMLGMMMFRFNQGVLVVASVILGYSTVLTVLRATTEGTLMSPNRNTYLMVLRVTAGFALLIPSPATGYSMLQNVMMKVVKQSVSFADMTWSYALDYIDEGGSVWRNSIVGTSTGAGVLKPAYIKALLVDNVPDVTKLKQSADKKPIAPVNTADLKAQKSGDGTTAFLQVLLKNEVCMYTQQYSSGGSGNFVVFNPPSVSADQSAINFSDDTTNSDGCGAITLSKVPDKFVQLKTATTAVSQNKLKANTLMPIVTELLPAAKAIACWDKAGAAGFTDLCVAEREQKKAHATTPAAIIPAVVTAGDAMYGAFLDYSSKATLAAQAAQTVAGQGMNAFIPRAKSEGWVMAGSYYWDLSRLQSEYSKVSDYSSYVSASAATPPKSDSLSSTTLGLINQTSTMAYDNLYFAAQATSKGAVASTGMTGGNAALQAVAGMGLLNILLGPLGPVFNDIIDMYALFSTHNTVSGMGTDPVLFLYRLGSMCINMAADLIIGAAVGFTLILLPGSFCKAEFDAQTPMMEGMEWLKPVLVASSAMFFGVGVLLAYFVPMYPYLVYLFAVVGWLIVVIEAIVAMPLVAMEVTHPEGHDLLGKGEQALMLMLGVFLRPVLMVIGLISGMILSYVSLRIVVWSFGSFLFDLYHPDSAAAGTILLPTGDDPILAGAGMATLNLVTSQGGSPYGNFVRLLMTTPLLFIVFAGIVYQVITQCYSLIFVLPDYILRWVGGPTQPGAMSPAQMASQVQGQLMGAANKVGGLASQGAKDYLTHGGRDSGEGTTKNSDVDEKK